MKARLETISTGDEIARGRSTDTNAPWIAGEAAKAGVIRVRHTATGDDLETLAAAIRDAAARAEFVVVSGGRPRYYFQSPSLFGLEHYGTPRQTRAMGYAWGQLSAAGEVRVWPLKRIIRGGGEAAFVHDQAFPEAPDGVPIGPLWVGARPQQQAPADWIGYLKGLVDRTDTRRSGGDIPDGGGDGADGLQ